MIETLIILSLSALFLIFIRPSKTLALDNTLVIERLGQYHMTLAPQLSIVQPFIEAIANLLGTSSDATQYSTTQYFEVRDKHVTVRGHDFYLLAITLRNGVAYFQAVSPQIGDPNSHLEPIMEFANAVLARFPATGEHRLSLNEQIVASTLAAARLRSIQVKRLAQ